MDIQHYIAEGSQIRFRLLLGAYAISATPEAGATGDWLNAIMLPHLLHCIQIEPIKSAVISPLLRWHRGQRNSRRALVSVAVVRPQVSGGAGDGMSGIFYANLNSVANLRSRQNSR